MPDVLLYPTETVYALGVNPLDQRALAALYELKGRDAKKAVSWLVRTADDIQRYADMSPQALLLASTFLPGPLTLVLPLKASYAYQLGITTIGFRISSDPIAQTVIAAHMTEHHTPLTCTSANVSGLAPKETVTEILAQFSEKKHLITKIFDDGLRRGTPSTVVEVIGDSLQFHREGTIPKAHIEAALLHS